MHIVLTLVAVYLVVAYVVLPLAWTHHDRAPGIENLPMRTHTSNGIPGDPINVGAIGSRETLLRAFAAAGWSPADPITLRSSLDIALSVVMHRPDDQAPVSPLFYDGRKQDLAFEKQVGGSADKRHHIRFWMVKESGEDGRPFWLASAAFDEGVELSRFTGQVTHHIGADVDAERDFVIDDLTRAHVVERVYEITGSGPTFYGRNGGGDPYFTDGEVKVAVLVKEPGGAAVQASVETPPVLAQRKRALFDAYRAATAWLF
ncbi:MAG: LssY C-terminal domain-containing protein [Beijerinckiaceae bacterium]